MKKKHLKKIKKEFKKKKMDLILINDGDEFWGSWAYLYLDHGIYPYQLHRWCDLLRYDYHIIKN